MTNCADLIYSYITFKHVISFSLASYFMVDLEAASSMPDLLEGFKHRDIDLIRHGIKKKETVPVSECEGPYSDLYTGASYVNKMMLRPKKKKGAVKWPNLDKLD